MAGNWAFDCVEIFSDVKICYISMMASVFPLVIRLINIYVNEPYRGSFPKCVNKRQLQATKILRVLSELQKYKAR